MDSGSYKIRPAGRHLLTIGRDLIQDSYAAVVELVKNAYDADSQNVIVEFEASLEKESFTFSITDSGHGMSRETVIDKWMVPSTGDKLKRKISPKGRTLQGRKGVGRYAASILGKDLFLETTTEGGESTTAFIEWKSFEDAEYLEDVEILIETKDTVGKKGTNLTIRGGLDQINEWNKKQFDKLKFELKKLIPPVQINSQLDRFDIILKISGFGDDYEELMEPYPIIDFFDYRIYGHSNQDGEISVEYINQKAKNTVNESIKFNFDKKVSCGNLYFDIRVYDRDSESIEMLINRGLKNDDGNYIGKLQAKKLLDKVNGIGVYRNGFRIRPMGDPDNDWLKLNEQRVQNPSLKIGSNQVIGFVFIQSEESSGLIEKSARDGLKDNSAFDDLKEITGEVIKRIETRRYAYRQLAGITKKKSNVNKQLDTIFSLNNLKKRIKTSLIEDQLSENRINEILQLIDQDEKEKSDTAENLKQVIASYQGQATLGKIINVVLHEGRRPLSYFRNQSPRLIRYVDKIIKNYDPDHLNSIREISEGVLANTADLSDLFKKIDPLATGRRSKKQLIDLKKEIKTCFDVYLSELKEKDISYKIEGSDIVDFSGWPQDIRTIFINLIDNSIYWLDKDSIISRKIFVTILEEDSKFFIDFRDTGPGIESIHLIEDLIFEPEFTTKTGGTGIGLAIAGEAAQRNGLTLTALDSNEGAYFRIEIKE